jgi:hypothetical protein
MTVVHDFRASLAASHSAADWPGWEPLYRDLFPAFAAMVDHRADGEHQRAGIDRSIVLSNGKQILIDEKVRGRNRITGRVYSDVLLEVWADRGRRVPGWAIKQIRADYIAYLIAPLGICHLLPVVQLQSAWSVHGEDWTRRHGTRNAENPSWVTVSVPVPIEELYPAIGSCLRGRFQPFEGP